MYKKVDKSKENKSDAVTNSFAQKQGSDKSNFNFFDNRHECIAQRKLREIVNNGPQAYQLRAFQDMANGTSAPRQMLRPRNNDSVGGNEAGGSKGIVQLKTVTVRNTTDNYSSGWVQAETQSTGVDDGPRAEAQSVAEIAGGTWVGGHMVNDRLGGHGGFGNIVPITSSMNNQHHTIENAAQNIVGANGTEYEVRYRMSILNRQDYTFGDNDEHEVKNLACEFQQHYDYRTKEVPAGGTRSRPIPYQAPGNITTVDGEELEMDV